MKLKEIREQKGKTRKDIADFLSITVQAYGNYETNRREPDYSTLKKLADYLNVSVDYILDREVATPQSNTMFDKTEQEMLSLFRTLDVQGQREAIGVIKAVIGQDTAQNKRKA